MSRRHKMALLLWSRFAAASDMLCNDWASICEQPEVAVHLQFAKGYSRFGTYSTVDEKRSLVLPFSLSVFIFFFSFVSLYCVVLQFYKIVFIYNHSAANG